ncbi:hypothetical protein K490DRAFT_41286 [Saccharata proteae CBS 121410]|uniref:FAD-binding domain-containing protein n=1 Tax=Saccharata proteae CBS 121410 TaxID=1314787 RepID=A0A9P4HY39_9PEZI|nr:hypothetical protein K490DRAFT_41286 [Saccharata proteae CBS 121410]
MPVEITETELLIVGAGPAGASLACFLASHGLTGIMITSAPFTAPEPRAHLTNMASTECLRDIGLEEECIRAATPSKYFTHVRWCNSMAGEEYARMYAWGNDPARQGDYDAASPCPMLDLPQDRLEPILVRWACQHGFHVRFDTKFLSMVQEVDGYVVSTVKDRVTGSTYQIRSKYLFGADGGRSKVIEELGIPLIKKQGGGIATNVMVKADLTHLMEQRAGNLHWVLQPEIDAPAWSAAGVARMVRPWKEWLFVFMPALDSEPFSGDKELLTTRCKQLIGDPNVEIEIGGYSTWYVNDIVAEYYSKGNVHCLGDAVHRHPPTNGLGSNTCIQDAYNLAWKVAFVMKGLASPSLLDSYSAERQLVGEQVVAKANAAFQDHMKVISLLGTRESTKEERVEAVNELGAATPQGVEKRARFKSAMEQTRHEFQALGTEMNRRYVSGAVYLRDEGPRPESAGDKVLDLEISTYPGSRVPHAWLNTTVPGKQISTMDLVGHGRFCLLTGIGGGAWKEAAAAAGRELGLEMKSYSIGWRQDYEDVYLDWARRREIGEDGCLLVRPDRIVAWRSMGMIDCRETKLVEVLRSILSR